MDNEQLEKWQIRQIEKCKIENAINGIIEAYSIQGEFPALNILQFYEHQNSSNFEESAILMAIHAHGLQQNHPSSTIDNDSNHHHQLRRQQQLRPCPPSSQLQSSSSSSIVCNNLQQQSINQNASSSSYMDNNENNVNYEISNLMETAVSVAIQKQGLGLGLEPNR